MSGSVWEASWMSGSGREALPDVWIGREALPDIREWLGGPPGCPGGVGRPCRMFRIGNEALSDVRE